MELTQKIKAANEEFDRIRNAMRFYEYALDYEPGDFYDWSYEDGDYVPKDKYSSSKHDKVRRDQDIWFDLNNRLDELYTKLRWYKIFQKMTTK
jgi:hypothetical protein